MKLITYIVVQKGYCKYFKDLIYIFLSTSTMFLLFYTMFLLVLNFLIFQSNRTKVINQLCNKINIEKKN